MICFSLFETFPSDYPREDNLRLEKKDKRFYPMLHVWLADSRQPTALFGNNSTFTQLLLLHRRNITKWFLRVCFQIEFPSHARISVVSHG